MKEGPLVQMLDRQRVQQAAADEAKKLVDAAALAAERLVDERVCCLLVLNSGTSTPQWIRQPKAAWGYKGS